MTREAITMAAMLLVVCTSTEADVLNTGGQACNAITPNQARRFEWRSQAMFNRDPNGRAFFATCPFDRGADDRFNFMAFYIANENNFSTEVDCFIRTVNPVNASERVVANFSDVAPPNTVLSFITDIITVDNFSSGTGLSLNHFVLVCRLEAGQGIVQIASFIDTTNDGATKAVMRAQAEMERAELARAMGLVD